MKLHFFNTPSNFIRLVFVITLMFVTASFANASLFVKTAIEFNKGIFANGFTVEDINNVLENFIQSFENGDLDNFAALFDKDVKIEEGEGTLKLRKDYGDLFDNSFKRTIRFRNASWRENDNGVIWGDVDFVLNIGNRVDGKINRMSGTMRFYFKKTQDVLVITSLFYVYDK